MPSQDEILKKYDAELQRYANSVAIPFGQLLNDSRAPYQPFLKYLFDFYLFMSYLVENHLIPNDSKHTPLRILFAKAALSLFGVYTCLQNGLVTEATNSLRSLFEVYVNVKLILERDSDVRLKLFEDFELVEKWNHLKANQVLLRDGKMSQAQFDKTFDATKVLEIQAGYDAVKADYHPKQPHHWAWKIFSGVLPNQRNPSLRFIADQLGLLFDYVKVYSSTSIAVHGSASLVNVLSTGQSVSLAPQFTRMICTDGCLALVYAAQVVELLAEYFKFQHPDEIKMYVGSYVLAATREADKGAA